MGRSHALLLASRGAKVVVADNGAAMDGGQLTEGLAGEVVSEIASTGGEAVACTANLAEESGSQEAVQLAIDTFGRIDGIVHNASTVPDLVPTDMVSTHDLDVVLRINTYAGLWMARAAWPHMEKQRYGRILYTTSVGIFGQEGTAAYSAAKAASIGIMRTLADEGTKHGICVNVIAPSARTRMTERFLTSAYGEWLLKTMPPEKVSVAAAYLMSEDNQISGEIISLGGGRIGRIVLGESEGFIGAGEAIEEVRDAMPSVLADTRFFYPKDVAERSMKVAKLLGFEG